MNRKNRSEEITGMRLLNLEYDRFLSPRCCSETHTLMTTLTREEVNCCYFPLLSLGNHFSFGYDLSPLFSMCISTHLLLVLSNLCFSFATMFCTVIYFWFAHPTENHRPGIECMWMRSWKKLENEGKNANRERERETTQGPLV